MTFNIKSEKVVNNDIQNNSSLNDIVSIDEFNRLRSENENLKLLLSYNKVASKDQKTGVDELSMKIVDLNKIIENLKHQITSLKQTNENKSNEIDEQSKYLENLYSTINNIDVNGTDKEQVTDPKNATLRLNSYRQTIKKLKTKVIENKILIMTMCKILNCDHCKIVQSMKDIIDENKLHKKKYQVYEQFYHQSVALNTNMSEELHRSGYEKAPPVTNGVFCQVHSETFEHWPKKMLNTRYQNLHKKDKNLSQNPKFTPIKTDSNRNRAPHVTNSSNKTNYLQTPPPGYHMNTFNPHYPPPVPPPVGQFNQFVPDLQITNVSWILPSPNHIYLPSELDPRLNRNHHASNTRSNSGFSHNNPASFTSGSKRVVDIDVQSPQEPPNPKKIHLINEEYSKVHDSSQPNVYDWKDFTVEEGKLELEKLEKEMSSKSLVPQDPFPANQNEVELL